MLTGGCAAWLLGGHARDARGLAKRTQNVVDTCANLNYYAQWCESVRLRDGLCAFARALIPRNLTV